MELSNEPNNSFKTFRCPQRAWARGTKGLNFLNCHKTSFSSSSTEILPQSIHINHKKLQMFLSRRRTLSERHYRRNHFPRAHFSGYSRDTRHLESSEIWFSKLRGKEEMRESVKPLPNNSNGRECQERQREALKPRFVDKSECYWAFQRITKSILVVRYIRRRRHSNFTYRRGDANKALRWKVKIAENCNFLRRRRRRSFIYIIISSRYHPSSSSATSNEF